MVVPIIARAGAVAGSRAGPLLGRIVTGAKNIFSRATVNPFAGRTVKEGFKAVGKTLLGGATSGGVLGASIGVARYGAGVEPNILSAIKRGVTFGVAGGLSIPGAVIGAVSGYGERGVKAGINEARSFLDKFKETPQEIRYPQSGMFPGMVDTSTTNNNYLDQLRDMGMPSYQMGDTVLNFPATPSAGGIGSFGSPQIDVNMPSMGGMDFSTLLMLMGLGVGGGYLAGRKRKKKKYKKKKKRK
jgi:hypothetical protein